MINTLSSNLGALHTTYTNSYSSGKIEVPVPSSVSVYAQFKYVRGVPASSNQQSVSLSRAQIIDNMVSYLNSSSENQSFNSGENFKVEELEQEVHRVVNEEPPRFNSFPSHGSDTGVIFNLSA